MNSFYIKFSNLILTGLLILLMLPAAWAQQVPLLNNYYRNPYLFNPGFSRTDSVAELMAIYRNQWAGIEGAPENHMLALNGLTVRRNWVFGGLFYNDISNITKRTGIYLSSSYLIQLSSEQNLRLGISAGVLQNRIDFNRIKAADLSEPTLIAASDSRTAFDGNAGLYYNYNQVEVGVSSIHLFNSRLNYANTTFDEQAGMQLLRHYFIYFRYRNLYEQGVFRFSPLLMLRSVQSLPLGWDIGGMLEFKDLLFFSPVYKSNYGLALNLGVHLNGSINVAYAYEIPFNELGPYSKGTHEFALQVTFKTGDRKALSTVYQSVQEVEKTEKPSREEKKQKNKENIHPEYEESHFHAFEKKFDSLQVRFENLSKMNQESKHKLDSLEQHDKVMAELVKKNQFELEITREELRALENKIHLNLSEKHIYFEEEHIHLDSLEEFDNKRWNYYVVTGSYHDLNAAKFMVRTLKDEYNIDAKVVTDNNDKNSYNVVTKQVYNRAEAIEEISNLDAKVRKQLMPKGARLYQVRK